MGQSNLVHLWGFSVVSDFDYRNVSGVLLKAEEDCKPLHFSDNFHAEYITVESFRSLQVAHLNPYVSYTFDRHKPLLQRMHSLCAVSKIQPLPHSFRRGIVPTSAAKNQTTSFLGFP